MAIKRLMLAATKVSDLSPLEGMPLEILNVQGTTGTDLSALQGMPLTSLRLNGCAELTDISALRGASLNNLTLHDCPKLTDLAPLADCKSLRYFTLSPNAKGVEFLRDFPILERISFKEDASNGRRPDKTAAEFWNEYDEKTQVAGAIRDAGFTLAALTRRADGTWEVNLTQSASGDLKALRRLPIGGLLLGNTDVTDLGPLRGMALKKLYLFNTKVTDLSPLAGMPLEMLQVSGTKVTDLSVLRGMPLTFLRFHGCRDLTDLAALADCEALESLTLPPNATGIEFLRAFPKLQRIGFRDDPKNGHVPDKTAAEFWKEYDAKKN